MFKHEELADVDSCLNKAGDNEVIFVLRAKDPDAPATVRFWAQRRVAKKRNAPLDLKVISALQCADDMEQQGTVLRGEATDAG